MELPDRGHLNLRWTMADMMAIEDMIRRHYDAYAIGEAMMISRDEVREIARRNGWMVPK